MARVGFEAAKDLEPRRRVFRLDQIPFVAVQVFEDGDDSVGFFARVLQEFHIARVHCVVVAPEIVGVEEQENAAAGLIADATQLLGRLPFP